MEHSLKASHKVEEFGGRVGVDSVVEEATKALGRGMKAHRPGDEGVVGASAAQGWGGVGIGIQITADGLNDSHGSTTAIPVVWNALRDMSVLEIAVHSGTGRGVGGLSSVEGCYGGLVCNTSGSNGAVGEEAGYEVVRTNHHSHKGTLK